jgi:hemolysin activation/secretion protein
MRQGFKIIALMASAVAGLLTSPASAATPADRADPLVERDMARDEPAPPKRGDIVALPAAPAAVAAPADGLVVGAVRVVGAVELPAATFAPAIEPWLGRPLGEAELRALATAVAAVARRAGYPLASAWVPRQTVIAGTLKIVIDEGRIDAVEAEGSGAEAVGAMLRKLVTGRPVRAVALERQLLLAGDGAGVALDRPRLERRDGRNVLRVRARQDRLAGRLGLDNWGSNTLGPVRARAEADFNGVLTPSGRLSLGAVMTPLQPKEFQFVRLGYSTRLNTLGTQLALDAYHGRSNPGGALSGRDLEGRSTDVEATLTHPVLRSRAASLWGSLELGLRDSALDRAGAPARDDRIVSLTAGANGLARFGGGWLRGRLSLRRGLGLLDSTDAGDPLASRPDGSARFTKLAFSASWSRPLGRGLTTFLAMEGQLASRPLLASEEIGLGGRSFLRGYDYREVSGDRGAAASAELRFDLKGLPRSVSRVQPYVYADAGRVANLRAGSGGGTLASAGGGLRVALREGIDAGVELGVPLRDSPFDADPKPRFSFTIGARF